MLYTVLATSRYQNVLGLTISDLQSTDHRLPSPDSPLYHHLWGPNQWPSAKALPKFRPAYEEYMRRMSDISVFFTSLIAESIGLESTAFDKFFDVDQQHKLKLVYVYFLYYIALFLEYFCISIETVLVHFRESSADVSRVSKYPDNGDGAGQGVGPHKDSMLTSYLLQASDHKGLQAQNTAGEWIDCPPIDSTLVVAIGQGMEAITSGVCASTTHRVLSPEASKGARYSIPFFQGVSFDAKFENMAVPEEVKRLRPASQRKDDVEFTFKVGKYASLGEATLMNRIKSHPDVGKRWVSWVPNFHPPPPRERAKRYVCSNSAADNTVLQYPKLFAQIRMDQAEEAEKKMVISRDRDVPQVNANQTAVQVN